MIPVHCAVFDIGKTNKKLFVFDENYRIVFEKSERLPETTDEDGDPCEDVHLLRDWVLNSLHEVLSNRDFHILAINSSAYGASFVYLDKEGKIIAPLYNYLKPYPEKLKQQFYQKYGGEEAFARTTASPVLGSLNSGIQLYRLKYERPDLFQKVKYALHLPQYVSHLIHGRYYDEITSLGCHTNLWDFTQNTYHDWVSAEGIDDKFPELYPSNRPAGTYISGWRGGVGHGLHDSSAALIPYLESFKEPFVLISTGTWNISLNPFNYAPLTDEELRQDCLCYLSWKGTPVKASRLFAGYEHEQAVKKMAEEYGVREDFYTSPNKLSDPSRVTKKLSESYLAFMRQLVERQAVSTMLAISDTPVQRIFVDGGFSKNEIFMSLLAKAFPNMEIYAAEVAQASALGAAMAIHGRWNDKPLRQDLIALKKYRAES